MLINRESLVISQQARLEYNNVTTHTYEPIIAFHLATGFVGRRYTTPNTHFRVPILHALLTLLLKTLSFSLSLSIRYPPTTPIEIIASRFRLRFCPIVDASRSSTNVPNRRCLYRHDKAPDPRFSIKISYCKFHFFLRSRNESIDLATYRVYRWKFSRWNLGSAVANYAVSRIRSLHARTLERHHSPVAICKRICTLTKRRILGPVVDPWIRIVRTHVAYSWLSKNHISRETRCIAGQWGFRLFSGCRDYREPTDVTQPTSPINFVLWIFRWIEMRPTASNRNNRNVIRAGICSCKLK